MIIVEGPDGAGKTTLLESLSRGLNLPIAPRVVSKDAEAMTDLREWVAQNLASGFQELLFDRHRLISEFIYGPILRTHQEEGFSDPEWVWEAINQFYELNPFIIYCLPSLQVVENNIWWDEDNKVVWSHIKAIYTAYLKIAMTDRHFRPDRVLIYDYLRDNPSKVLSFIDYNKE